MGTLICGENKMDTSRCIKRIQSWYNYSKANQDTIKFVSLQWGHNKRDDVTGHCGGNSPVTGEFPSQRASNEENFSIWWRHHEYGRYMYCISAVVILRVFVSVYICLYNILRQAGIFSRLSFQTASPANLHSVSIMVVGTIPNGCYAGLEWQVAT